MRNQSILLILILIIEGKETRAVAKETMLSRIFEWRKSTAIFLKMSPESVLTDSLAKRIVISQLSAESDLRTIGLRVPDEATAVLSKLLVSSLVELRLTISSNDGDFCKRMAFDEGRITAPVSLVHNTSMKGKTKPAAWEASYDKFRMGVSIDSIAALHPTGIQVQTVVGHLLDAFKFGKPIDMRKFTKQADSQGYGPPTQKEWELLETAGSLASIDPESGTFFPLKTLLVHVPAVTHLISPPVDNCSESDRLLIGKWYSVARWWNLLRMTKFLVRFE